MIYRVINPNLQEYNTTYPAVVAAVVPVGLRGLVAAAIVGAIMWWLVLAAIFASIYAWFW
jgi:uncharacterized sodium:solute symporter family permease YidK